MNLMNVRLRLNWLNNLMLMLMLHLLLLQLLLLHVVLTFRLLTLLVGALLRLG